MDNKDRKREEKNGIDGRYILFFLFFYRYEQLSD
jgi:hypothetical protein